MPSTYPTNDQVLEAFVTEFLANIGAIMTTLTLPATFDDALVAAKATFTTGLGLHVAAQTDAVEKRQSKDDSKTAMLAALRALVAQLRANPGFTNAMAAALGLAVYDNVPSPSVPGTEIPTLAVEVAGPQAHRIKFFQTSDEGFDIAGKPEWARACRIMRAIVEAGQPCPPIESMSFLASDSASPHIAAVAGAHVGKDAYYRGAWESHVGEAGLWSEAVRMTITG